MSETTDLDAAARAALRLLGPAPENWVPDRSAIDHNVCIVGGGQTGAAIAFALRRAGIGKVTVIDAAPDGASSGVWLDTARMQKLRTPKGLVGPELGVAALGFQAWFEARHGAAAYDAIDRIPRTLWAEYLGWYRRFLEIPVRYATRLDRIAPVSGHVRLHLRIAGRAVIETARKVILANGVSGSGGPYVPAVLSDSLPPTSYSHTADRIDFGALRGKSVALIGGAASAFDAAAVALEAGAATADLFVRRPSVASLPVLRARGYPGAYDNYRHLPDAIRWHQAVRYRQAGSTPPPDAITRVTSFANFRLHLAAPWTSARLENGKVLAESAGRSFAFDHVIAGTGYVVDLASRGELQDFADHILLWRHRYTPPAGEENDELGAHPYLDHGHAFVERQPGAAPFLKDIHVFNPGGFVSFGLPIGDVPCMRRDIPSVVAQISRDLFLADLDLHQRRITGPVAPDFDETLYRGALAEHRETALA
jgi:cation diffusion facilitator CzcD-associated flavoprotein CzcO